MWTFIVGAVAKVGGMLASLANALIKWMAVLFAFRLGKKTAEAEQSEKVAETQAEQLKDAARPPRSKSQIIERMKDGDL